MVFKAQVSLILIDSHCMELANLRLEVFVRRGHALFRRYQERRRCAEEPRGQGISVTISSSNLRVPDFGVFGVPSGKGFACQEGKRTQSTLECCDSKVVLT